MGSRTPESPITLHSGISFPTCTNTKSLSYKVLGIWGQGLKHSLKEFRVTVDGQNPALPIIRNIP